MTVVKDEKRLPSALGKLPTFQGLSRTALQELARAGVLSSLPPRWTFIHQRTPADSAYVVLDGEVVVVVNGAEVARLTDGAVLGETALVENTLRTASVSTVTRVQLLHIDAPALAALMRHSPAVAERLLADYRRRSDDASAAE